MEQTLLFSFSALMIFLLVSCFQPGTAQSVDEVCVGLNKSESHLFTDGCNSCSCRERRIICSRKDCPEIYNEKNKCEDGQSKPYGDGCNFCSCFDQHWICSKKSCTQVKANKCLEGQVEYAPNKLSTFSCHRGQWECRDGNGTCSTDEECLHGTSKPFGDGCNGCSCSHGRWACTKMGCPQCDEGQGWTTRLSEGGCNVCHCAGGYRKCTRKECPECLDGEMKATPDGCSSCTCKGETWSDCTDGRCPEESKCDFEGWWKKKDCNKCICKSGTWDCTNHDCGTQKPAHKT